MVWQRAYYPVLVFSSVLHVLNCNLLEHSILLLPFHSPSYTTLPSEPIRRMIVTVLRALSSTGQMHRIQHIRRTAVHHCRSNSCSVLGSSYTVPAPRRNCSCLQISVPNNQTTQYWPLISALSLIHDHTHPYFHAHPMPSFTLLVSVTLSHPLSCCHSASSQISADNLMHVSH